jgi:hypothetical protein
MALLPSVVSNWAPPPNLEYAKAAEEWSATPTPVYDEFKVDWKKLHASSDTPEARRIEAMWSAQMEKLRQTYPKFDFSKVKWPAGDSMMQLPSAMGLKLASFQNAERWALSGFESPAHLLAADNEAKRKAAEQAAIANMRMKRRETELKGLFGGKKTRKGGKKSRVGRKAKTTRKH